MVAILSRSTLLVLGVLGTLGACEAQPPPAPPPAPAELVLQNGRIATVDDGLGVVEALAIRGDRIVAAGSAAEIAPLVGPQTRVIDLRGRLAVPGFIESHAHFTGVGDAQRILDLTKAATFDDVVAMVQTAARSAAEGTWILGRGWHQEKWRSPPHEAVHGFPTHRDLSAVSPAHPVLLTHASGHACLCNARAMELAGIGRDTPDPAGGEVVRDSAGEPIGVLLETAQGLLQRARSAAELRRDPAERDEEMRRTLRLADRECQRHGVTSFQDAGSSFRTVDAMREMLEKGEIKTQLWVMIRESNDRVAELMPRYRTVGSCGQRLTVRAIKRTLDGALGARGAWLLEPYTDLPASTGLATATPKDVGETARIAVANEVQLCVHAIGDRANRETLDLFERAFASPAALKAARWRVEHAQHIDPQDQPRFARLGVIASMQGIHCTSDAPFVVPRLGEARAKAGAYVWRALLDSGCVIANGTDAPVEPVDPLASYCASVTRRLADGSTFHAEQRMTREEALASYTKWAAWAAFEDDVKGTLTPGKLADVVVLSKDILRCADEELTDAEVDVTILGGEVVYERAP
jgi:predicted amidohydrolase YtcJ